MPLSCSTCLLTGTLLLIAVCPVAAQTLPSVQTPTPSVDSPPVPRTETLHLKFTVGQTLYYKLIEDTVGSYREPKGKLTPIKSHLEMRLHETTSDLRDTDNAGLVDVGIDSMTVTIDGKSVSTMPEDLAAMANLARLIVLPTGKIEDTQANPVVNADEVLAGEDPAHMNALAGLGTLPETPVQVGTKWKSPVFLGLIGEKSTVDLSLTGWETKDTASIAVIKQVIQGKFETPAGTKAHPSGDMKLTGGVAGTRIVRFNIDAGSAESEDSLTYMNVIMTPKAVDEDTPILPTRMWVRVTSKLTRIAAAP